MSSANRALVLLLVITFGLWGCSKGPDSGSGNPIRTLETKLSKVEEELRTTATAREELRKQLAAVEEQRNRLQKQVADLSQQVSARTSERDALQTQYDQFRNGIRNLLGQAEAAAPNFFKQHVTEVAKAPTGGKS